MNVESQKKSFITQEGKDIKKNALTELATWGIQPPPWETDSDSTSPFSESRNFETRQAAKLCLVRPVHKLI